MSGLFVLFTGSIFRKDLKTSKTGTAYMCATVKAVVAGSEGQFLNVVAFAEALIAELRHLDVGDVVSIQGAMKASIYDSSSGPKISLNVVADQVLALRQPPKKRTAKPDQRQGDSVADQRPFNDQIDF